MSPRSTRASRTARRSSPGRWATVRAPEAAVALRTTAGTDAGTPRDRLHTLVRALLDSDDGIDVFETADAPAREHRDPRRRPRAGAGAARRHRADPGALRVDGAAARHRDGPAAPAQQARARRDGCRVRSTSRRCAARSAKGRSARDAFGPFKTELVAELGALGYFVNEFGIARRRDAHRDRRRPGLAADRGLEATAGEVRPAAAGGRRDPRAARRAPPRRDARRGRPAAPRRPSCSRASSRRVPPRRPIMRARAWSRRSRRRCARSCETAAAEFLVDIAHEDFILRLALHVQNLQHRAREQRVVAQSADEVAQVDVPDDLRGGGVHRERAAAASRHPAHGRRDRLHRDARRRAPRAQPAGRPAADRDDRVPRLLRAARAAALVGRPLARAGHRGRRRRDARRPGLGLDRHRPRADHDRSAGRR